MKISDMSWLEIRDLQKGSLLAVLPLGSEEQHGPHLPIGTDTLLAEGVASALEGRSPQKIVLLPTMCFGHSPHHMGFGAISSSHTNVALLIEDIAESLHSLGFTKLLLLNGHGGNRLPVQIAMQGIKNRIQALSVYSMDYWQAGAKAISKLRKSDLGGMGHACELETSLMLYLHPEKVKKDQISDDGTVKSNPHFGKDMFHSGILSMVENFDEFTHNGVYGKPSLASESSGELFFNAIINELTEISESLTDPKGIY